MKITKGTIFSGLILAALAGGLLYAFLPKPVSVDTAPVVRGPLQVTIDDDGRTRIKERYVITAPLAGQLQRISRKEGDRVELGKTRLAVIEPTEPPLLDPRVRAQEEARVKAAEATRSQANSNLERARAAQQLASADLARAKDLFNRGALAKQAYESAQEREQSARETTKAAQFAVRIAEFELEQAKAALLRFDPTVSPGQDRSQFEIYSPVTGRVLRVHQESATPVTPGTPLLEVGDPTDLEIVVDVLSSEAVKVHPGMKMLLEHWGGEQPLLARVRMIEPAAFMKVSALGVEEQRVNVIADLEAPFAERPSLGAAYRVEARIVLWEGTNVLQVPASALFRNKDGWAVYQIIAGRARLHPVKIGHSNGLASELLAGLSQNDRVVLYPSDRIRDGVKVRAR